jgi:hypothetical protein
MVKFDSLVKLNIFGKLWYRSQVAGPYTGEITMANKFEYKIKKGNIVTVMAICADILDRATEELNSGLADDYEIRGMIKPVASMLYDLDHFIYTANLGHVYGSKLYLLERVHSKIQNKVLHNILH